MRKLKPIDGFNNPCPRCPPRPQLFEMDSRIFIGFGLAQLTCDDRVVWDAGNREYDDCISGEDAERIAQKNPDKDWRIVIDGPMYGCVYQRHGKGEWVIVERSDGFA